MLRPDGAVPEATKFTGEPTEAPFAGDDTETPAVPVVLLVVPDEPPADVVVELEPVLLELTPMFIELENDCSDVFQPTTVKWCVPAPNVT